VARATGGIAKKWFGPVFGALRLAAVMYFTGPTPPSRGATATLLLGVYGANTRRMAYDPQLG
jgi:hypothetical protein